MVIELSDATQARFGGKAVTLGTLLRAGYPVPDGFVVPPVEEDASASRQFEVIDRALARLGNPVVAVRSSATDEDTPGASAAGQYVSVIGVRGAAEVCQAIATCRESARAARTRTYWARHGRASVRGTHVSVLVQRIVEAETAGVMFTAAQTSEHIQIEATWGLGLPVVDGSIDPDRYQLRSDGNTLVSVGRKQLRVDVNPAGGGVITRAMPVELQSRGSLDQATVADLTETGRRIASLLGAPQDIEWAIAGGTVWILQARPVTASLPTLHHAHSSTDRSWVKDVLVHNRAATGSIDDSISGLPGSRGKVTASARIVRGPSDFATVQPGEIVICPYTSPAWTPLFAVAAGVVTETGGALSHAAIVAREYGIPAVLGVSGATDRINDGARITVDGTAGTVTGEPAPVPDR